MAGPLLKPKSCTRNCVFWPSCFFFFFLFFFFCFFTATSITQVVLRNKKHGKYDGKSHRSGIAAKISHEKHKLTTKRNATKALSQL